MIGVNGLFSTLCKRKVSVSFPVSRRNKRYKLMKYVRKGSAKRRTSVHPSFSISLSLSSSESLVAYHGLGYFADGARVTPFSVSTGSVFWDFAKYRGLLGLIREAQGG